MKMSKKLLGLALIASLGAGFTGSAMATGASTNDLINDTKTPGDVTTYGMGYGQQRFSKLNQINRASVKNLVPKWNLSLDSNQPQSQQPLLA